MTTYVTYDADGNVIGVSDTDTSSGTDITDLVGEYFGSATGTSSDPYDFRFYRDVGTGVGNLGNMGGEGTSTIPTVNLSDPTTLTKAAEYFNKLITGSGTTADYGTLLAGTMGLYEYMNRDRGPKTWQGSVKKGAYIPPTVSPEYTKNIQSRAYGKPAMGQNPFVGGVYIPPIEAAPAPAPAAQGGLMKLAGGGQALPPRYLRGETDGMADMLPSSIDGRQPAKLSHGEFVIPADVVSHLGNGNSDAGAKELYKMMDRVRQARTGTKRQGKKIRPDKFMPGGIASLPGYSGGGAVAFPDGGTVTGSTSTTPSTTAQGLSPWVGDYIAGPEGFLSKAWALGDQPYQAYQGPLTAGVSPIQEKAFTTAQGLGTPSQFGTATSLAEKAGQAAGTLGYGTTQFTPGYTAGQFSTGLGPVGSVQSYMNPYMQNVVDIQAREARRQADIGRQAEQARLAQAGAYGGSRQAIMEAERQRNLGTQIGDIQEKGLQSAYDRALAQRAQEAQMGLQAQQYGEQARQFGATTGLEAQKAAEQSKQFGANFGLKGIEQQLAAAQQLGSLGTKQFDTQLQGLEALSKAGLTQQQAEQASIDAQIKQFQEAQMWPYKQLEFQQRLLQGLPVGTQSYAPTTSGLSDLMGGIGSLLNLYQQFGKVS